MCSRMHLPESKKLLDTNHSEFSTQSYLMTFKVLMLTCRIHFSQQCITVACRNCANGMLFPIIGRLKRKLGSDMVCFCWKNLIVKRPNGSISRVHGLT